MNIIKRSSALLLAFAMAFALGCAGDRRTASTGDHIDDSVITTKVKAALIEDPVVKARDVKVDTFKGVVQLSGFVNSRDEMNTAVRITSGIKGVASVRNELRIK